MFGNSLYSLSEVLNLLTPIKEKVPKYIGDFFFFFK